MVVVPSGRFAGQPLKLRPWQKRVLRGVFVRGVRQAYLQMPRQNGKTFMGVLIGLVFLLDETLPESLILSIAPTADQAHISLNLLKAIARSSPKLSHLKATTFNVVNTETGSNWQLRTVANSGTAGQDGEARLQGYRPVFALMDEAHLYSTRAVWDAVLAGQSSVAHPLILGTSTPGADDSSAAFELFTQAQSKIPGFVCFRFEADAGCDIHDRTQWFKANPALGDTIPIEAVEQEVATLPEHSFRRYRLGQWTANASSWFPVGVWQARGVDRRLVAGERIVVGFDGSLSGDSTALVGVTEDGFVQPLGHWEPGKGQRVPRDEVHTAVDRAFKEYRVVLMLCDPPYWTEEIAQWQAKYGSLKVLEFPTYSRQRMVPATTSFYNAVMEAKVTHDGSIALAEHVAHCVTKPDPQGDVVTKASRDSPRHIDLAIAAVIAYQAASRPKAKVGLYV